jgi:hypothetical protein
MDPGRPVLWVRQERFRGREDDLERRPRGATSEAGSSTRDAPEEEHPAQDQPGRPPSAPEEEGHGSDGSGCYGREVAGKIAEEWLRKEDEGADVRREGLAEPDNVPY